MRASDLERMQMRREGGKPMTKKQTMEVESVVNDYLDDMEIARRKVCDRIMEVVIENPLAEDDILYKVAQEAGDDLAIDVSKGLRKRVDEMERMDAKADHIRKEVRIDE